MHTSSDVIIFVRQGLSFSKLSTSSLSWLDPYFDYVGVSISVNNSSFLSFLNLYDPPFALLRWMAKPTPFLSPFFPLPEISSIWGTSIAITPSGTQEALPLVPSAALFTSLALNAAKSSIPFDCIKRHPKAWWFAEVEEVSSKRRKAFTATHRSDEDHQAYISASQHASSVIAKAKADT